jgi:hypothetical protein
MLPLPRRPGPVPTPDGGPSPKLASRPYRSAFLSLLPSAVLAISALTPPRWRSSTTTPPRSASTPRTIKKLAKPYLHQIQRQARNHVDNLERLGYIVTTETIGPATGELLAATAPTTAPRTRWRLGATRCFTVPPHRLANSGLEHISASRSGRRHASACVTSARQTVRM